MNKIAIFGGTGYTGLCALRTAVDKGLEVKALIRDVNKVPEDLKNKIELVVGNVLNYSDVIKTISDVNGVVVILGTRNDLSPTTDMSEGMKNVVKAMKELNVSIVSVCLSAFLFYEEEKVPARFKEVNADHIRMYQVVKESELQYIAVFPPHIADVPSAEFKVIHDASPGRVVSKHDLGKFLVESLSQPEHFGKVCGITNISNA